MINCLVLCKGVVDWSGCLWIVICRWVHGVDESGS